MRSRRCWSHPAFSYQRRSQWKEELPIAGGVFLLDSIGELASLYEFADLAFVGGSLVPRGGHNVLEAAQFGTPILVGPYTENFRDIIEFFRKADALRVVTPQIVDRDRAAIAGEPRGARNARSPGFRGHALAARCNRADRERAAGVAIGAGRAEPSGNHLGAGRMNPLAALYGTAVLARNELYDRGTLTLSYLQGPVVSIGNLTVGGSGKTPFLILLGELLKEHGILFDVLSRGYRRLTTGVGLVDPLGSPREYGDEPLLIARKLGVPVIVGEDRYAAGRLGEEQVWSTVALA